MIVLLLILLSLPAGCNASEKPEKWRITVQVADDENAAVPGAVVRIKGRKIKLNSNGNGATVIGGKEGDIITAVADCPKNWKASALTERNIVLKHVNLFDAHTSDSESTNIDLSFQCIPINKPHVLIVKTNIKAGLPVRINNEIAAHTNEDGVAQIVVTGKQNEQIQLGLNTDAHPLLMPQNPSLIISLPEKRKIMLFEQVFEKKTVLRKRRKKTRRRNAPRRL